MDNTALFKIGYGLYVLTAKDGSKDKLENYDYGGLLYAEHEKSEAQKRFKDYRRNGEMVRQEHT